MSQNRRRTLLTPDQVWSVIADASTYQHWVVGAKEVRAVDGKWPTEGAQLHHTVGAGPANAKDSTSVVESMPQRHLKLRGRFRSLGVAEIGIDLRSRNGETEVIMTERMVGGLGKKLPTALTNVMLWARNIESVRRLVDLAEQRAMH